MAVDRFAARRRPAHLAIFDATTLIAKGVKEQLVERSFPVASMRLFSTRSGDEASLSEFNGEAMLVGAPDLEALGTLDIAFLCGTREEGARYLEWAGRAGFVAIDLTTAANGSAGVPLVNAVVNPDAIPADPVLIATPHAISLLLSSLLGLGGGVSAGVASGRRGDRGALPADDRPAELPGGVAPGVPPPDGVQSDPALLHTRGPGAGPEPLR
jgi:hypothetical protein